MPAVLEQLHPVEETSFVVKIFDKFSQRSFVQSKTQLHKTIV
jgi:hypothetical protein